MVDYVHGRAEHHHELDPGSGDVIHVRAETLSLGYSIHIY